MISKRQKVDAMYDNVTSDANTDGSSSHCPDPLMAPQTLSPESHHIACSSIRRGSKNDIVEICGDAIGALRLAGSRVDIRTYLGGDS